MNHTGLYVKPRKRTRLQTQNEEKIVTAALDIFSANGYNGATLEQIAAAADMSKANVLYYFNKKREIYKAVLERTLAHWCEALTTLDPNGIPIDEIWNYTRQKLHFSRREPQASRLFAKEIMRGAPLIKDFLNGEMKELVDRWCEIVAQWVNDGKIAPIDPLQLIFLIWSSSQHLADFETQVDALHDGNEDELYQSAEQTLRLILTNGLRP